MEMPPLQIVDDIKVMIAKQRRCSPLSVLDAEVRIFMIHHADEVHALVDRYVPEVQEVIETGWTGSRVKTALINAFDMLKRTEGRVGPSRLKAAFIETSDGWGYADREKEERPNPRAFNASGMNASRMEMIVVDPKNLWVAGVDNPVYRRKLQAWVNAKLKSSSIAILCRRRKWAERTFRRDVSRAAQEIAGRLNREGVEVF